MISQEMTVAPHHQIPSDDLSSIERVTTDPVVPPATTDDRHGVSLPGQPHQKNPQKVAAGRAGAAARKAKHEKILAELREAKAPLQRQDDRETVGPSQQSCQEGEPAHEIPPSQPDTTCRTDWVPALLVIAGMGVAGGVWWRCRATTCRSDVTNVRRQPSGQPTAGPPVKSPHLNTSDPFIME